MPALRMVSRRLFMIHLSGTTGAKPGWGSSPDRSGTSGQHVVADIHVVGIRSVHGDPFAARPRPGKPLIYNRALLLQIELRPALARRSVVIGASTKLIASLIDNTFANSSWQERGMMDLPRMDQFVDQQLPTCWVRHGG